MSLWKEIRFFAFCIKKNFENEKVLRVSFLLQAVGMFLSNLSFFIIWILFSKAVGPVNGWGALQTFGMTSVSILCYGIVHSVFGSLMWWPEKVPSGAFDVFLTKPKSLYVRAMSGRFSVSACGDLIQGIIGVGIFLYLSDTGFQNAMLLFIMLPPAIIIQFSFLMFLGCVIFWLPQAPSLPRSLANLILLPATQPISMLDGAMRFIYLFIIPALLLGGLPIETAMNPGWKIVLLAYGIAGFWLFVSHRVFHVAIRRYESGNGIGAGG